MGTPLEKEILPPQGTLTFPHADHFSYKPAIKWDDRIPTLLHICPSSAPQLPLSYPKVTFLRFRPELNCYLEVYALYTVASLLGPQFLFSLAGVFTKSRLET